MIITFWIIFVISVLLIIVSTIMSPNSNSFSGALVGSSDLELFKNKKEKGSKLVLKRAMFILGMAFMLGSLLIRVYS